MKKKINIAGLFILVFIMIFYFYKLFFNKSYKFGGVQGYSKSLAESKERNVFLKSLSYKVTSGECEISNKSIILEKSFKYGDNSIRETVISTDEYQIVVVCNYKPCKKFFPCNYDCKEGKYLDIDTLIQLNKSYKEIMYLKIPYLKDTLKYDILVNNYKEFSTDTIGSLKVWDEY